VVTRRAGPEALGGPVNNAVFGDWFGADASIAKE